MKHVPSHPCTCENILRHVPSNLTSWTTSQVILAHVETLWKCLKSSCYILYKPRRTWLIWLNNFYIFPKSFWHPWKHLEPSPRSSWHMWKHREPGPKSFWHMWKHIEPSPKWSWHMWKHHEACPKRSYEFSLRVPRVLWTWPQSPKSHNSAASESWMSCKLSLKSEVLKDLPWT